MRAHTHARAHTHIHRVFSIAAQVFVQHWRSFKAKEAYEFSTGNLNQKEM